MYVLCTSLAFMFIVFNLTLIQTLRMVCSIQICLSNRLKL